MSMEGMKDGTGVSSTTLTKSTRLKESRDSGKAGWLPAIRKAFSQGLITLFTNRARLLD